MVKIWLAEGLLGLYADIAWAGGLVAWRLAVLRVRGAEEPVQLFAGAGAHQHQVRDSRVLHLRRSLQLGGCPRHLVLPRVRASETFSIGVSRKFIISPSPRST